MKASKHYHVYAHQDVISSMEEARRIVDLDNKLWGRISGLAHSYDEAISECSQKHVVSRGSISSESWSAVDMDTD